MSIKRGGAIGVREGKFLGPDSHFDQLFLVPRPIYSCQIIIHGNLSTLFE